MHAWTEEFEASMRLRIRCMGPNEVLFKTTTALLEEPVMLGNKVDG